MDVGHDLALLVVGVDVDEVHRVRREELRCPYGCEPDNLSARVARDPLGGNPEGVVH